MPRIPDVLLQSVGFLYPSADAAVNGDRVGGTGFLVRVNGDREPTTLVVTNQHVAAGCNHLRLTRTDTGLDVVEITEWVLHPDGDDVAVAVLSRSAGGVESGLDWSNLAATPERLEELNAGVGDEVIMIGRFIAHDGRVRNAPLARFGNIAMMPGEPVIDGRNLKVEAFLVEMRSLAGFSGSPVFVYMGPGTYRGDGRMMPFYTETIGLIGIDTGHKVLDLPIRDANGETTEYRAVQNSGVAIVAPVGKVREVLEDALRSRLD